MSRTNVSVNQQRSPSGGHPTPEQRQSRGRAARFVKLDQAALEALAAEHGLTRAQTAYLSEMVDELVWEWRYEPRIVPARSRRELWECLEHDGRRVLPALLEAGLVAEHPGTGFEVLCWAEVVADTPSDYEKRRARAVKDLAAGDRRARAVEALYAASEVYELPASSEHNVHTTAHNARTSEHNVRGRPALSRALEPLELPKPPLPPLDSQEEPPEALGVEVPSAESAEVLDLEQAQAAKYRAQVLDELADLEAAREKAAGKEIRSPGAYVRSIRSRLAADESLATALDALRVQYPADTPTELAARYDADRPGSGGARPDRRPVPNAAEQDAAGWAARVGRQSAYADQLAALDLAGGGAQ